MWFLIATFAIAVLVPMVTRGSYHRLFRHHWHWVSFLAIGMTLQSIVFFIDAPADHTHQVGFGLLVTGFVLVLGFTLRNALTKGMVVVSIGIAANFLAIVVNEGMPVEVPSDWVDSGGVSTTVRHHPQSADDDLVFLSDIVILRRIGQVISFGDLILAFGLIDVVFHASRRPRRAKVRATRTEPGVAIEGGESVDLTDRDLDGVDETGHRGTRDDEDLVRVGVGIDDTDYIELDITDAEPKPPSPVVAEVIEELTEMRRAARARHPSAWFSSSFRSTSRVHRAAEAARQSESDSDGAVPDGSAALFDDDLERLEHASVIHISGSGIEGLEREPGS